MEYDRDGNNDYGEPDNDNDLHSNRNEHNDRMFKHHERDY
jgi:hypothetical protein